MNIILYATATCPKCHALAEMMNEKGLSFTAKLLEVSDNLIEMLMVGSTRNTQRWTPPVLSVDGRFIAVGKEAEWIERLEVEK